MRKGEGRKKPDVEETEGRRCSRRKKKREEDKSEAAKTAKGEGGRRETNKYSLCTDFGCPF
jgi:hypothetical protein